MSDPQTDKMLSQLRTLALLTQTELQLSTVRQAQARTPDVRRALARGADEARARATRIDEAIRRLGGAPDVVGPAVGRLAAALRTGVEQAQPLSEALLAELALRHQLHDRSRYLRVLAANAQDTQVVRLAERLEAAHAAAIERLTTVLAEEAVGGPTDLRPTPAQLVAGTALRLTSLPARTLAERVNDIFEQVRSDGTRLVEAVDRARRTAIDVRDGAAEVVSAGRDAMLARAERVARRDGADTTAATVHDLRRATGSLDQAELPVRGYDRLNATAAIAAAQRLDDPADVRTLMAYEQAHKGRAGVLGALRSHLGTLASSALG